VRKIAAACRRSDPWLRIFADHRGDALARNLE
jgi:hypothetical protein